MSTAKRDVFTRKRVLIFTKRAEDFGVVYCQNSLLFDTQIKNKTKIIIANVEAFKNTDDKVSLKPDGSSNLLLQSILIQFGE